MIAGRRAFLISAALASAATTLGAIALRLDRGDVADPLRGRWPSVDVLLLHEGGADGAAAERALRARRGCGATIVQVVHLLDRAHIASTSVLIRRARGLQLIALLPPAQMIVLETLLMRAGAPLMVRHKTFLHATL